MRSILIKGGMYFDGSGTKGVVRDVLVQNQKVAQVAESITVGSDIEIIDATGKWVMPGFLDTHTHYDAEIEVLPGLEESVRHGVTTVVVGNCSLSAAVGEPGQIVDMFSRVESLPAQVLRSWLTERMTWSGPKEYFEHFERLPLGPNVAAFLGHSNIRMKAMGLERSLTESNASEAELQKMEALINEALDAGFLGLSIDMLPYHRMSGDTFTEWKGVSVPSQRASLKEYMRLVKPVRERGRVLEAAPNPTRKESMIFLALLSSGIWGKKMKTMVLAAMDFASNPLMSSLFKVLANVSNRGLRGDFILQALSAPFLVYGDGVINTLMEEIATIARAIGATPEERRQLFKDPAFRAQFRREWEERTASIFPKHFHAMIVTQSPDASHIGKSFTQIAYENDADPVEHFLDLMAQYDTDIRWHVVCANNNERERTRLQAHPFILPSFNDSGAHNRNMSFHDGALQTLKDAVRNPDILPIPEAIHRITKRQAEWLGIDAGDISIGKRADIVIVDPNRLVSDLTYIPTENYHPLFNGAMRLVKRSGQVVQYTIINGAIVYRNDQGQAQFVEDINQRAYGQLLRAS